MCIIILCLLNSQLRLILCHIIYEWRHQTGATSVHRKRKYRNDQTLSILTFLRSKSNSSWIEIENNGDAEIDDDTPTLNDKTVIVEQPAVERHRPKTAMSSYTEEVVQPTYIPSSYTEEIVQPIYIPKSVVTSNTKDAVQPTYLPKTAMSSYTEEIVHPIYLPKTVVASHTEEIEPTKVLRAWASNALKKPHSDPIDQDGQV